MTSWLLKQVQYCFETESTAVKLTPWKVIVQCVSGVPELTQCGECLVYLLQSCWSPVRIHNYANVYLKRWVIICQLQQWICIHLIHLGLARCVTGYRWPSVVRALLPQVVSEKESRKCSGVSKSRWSDITRSRAMLTSLTLHVPHRPAPPRCQPEVTDCTK